MMAGAEINLRRIEKIYSRHEYFFIVLTDLIFYLSYRISERWIVICGNIAYGLKIVLPSAVLAVCF